MRSPDHTQEEETDGHLGGPRCQRGHEDCKLSVLGGIDLLCRREVVAVAAEA